MKSYSVDLTKSAAKEFKKLPKGVKEKILEALNFLSLNPFSELLKIKKIKGSKSLLRIRVGDYRIVYEVEGQKLVVLVIKIGHRKDIYEKL